MIMLRTKAAAHKGRRNLYDTLINLRLTLID